MLLALATLSAAAKGKAQITFDTTAHDFGTIKENGGKVSAVYTFTNTGDEPLTIITVTNGGCGCTKPDFPKAPIAPGKRVKSRLHSSPKAAAASSTVP